MPLLSFRQLSSVEVFFIRCLEDSSKSHSPDKPQINTRVARSRVMHSSNRIPSCTASDSLPTVGAFLPEYNNLELKFPTPSNLCEPTSIYEGLFEGPPFRYLKSQRKTIDNTHHHAWLRLLQPHSQCCVTRKRCSTTKGYEYGYYNCGMYL